MIALWIERERPGDADALALSTGKFVRKAADMVAEQADGIQEQCADLLRHAPEPLKAVDFEGSARICSTAHARSSEA